MDAVLEGDSLLVVQATSNDTISLSSLGSFIADAKSFTNCFSELHYSYRKREGNKFAHNLAWHARNVKTTLCRWSLFLHLLFLLSRPI